MVLAACGGGQDNASIPEGMGLPDEDARTILSIDRSFQDAVRLGDWRTMRGLYAPDAVLMPPGHAEIEGVDSIVAYWEGTYPDDGIVGFKTDTEVIHGDNTIAYHRGTYTSDAEMMSRGKFLWVLRRMPNGEWRIVADMYNADGRVGPRMMPAR
jgi:ketosteroid isomerase-like protein